MAGQLQGLLTKSLLDLSRQGSNWIPSLGLHGQIIQKLVDAGAKHRFKPQKEYGTAPGKPPLGLGRVDVAWLQEVAGQQMPVALFEVIVGGGQPQIKGGVLTLLSIPSYLKVLVVPYDAIRADWRSPNEPKTKKQREEKQWLDKWLPNFTQRVLSRYPEISLWKDDELSNARKPDWIRDKFEKLLK